MGEILSQRELVGEILNQKEAMGEILSQKEAMGEIVGEKEAKGEIWSQQEAMGEKLSKNRTEEKCIRGLTDHLKRRPFERTRPTVPKVRQLFDSLSLRRKGLNPRPVNVGNVADKLTVRQDRVFIEYVLRFPPYHSTSATFSLINVTDATLVYDVRN
jgi:hypothetical protein